LTSAKVLGLPIPSLLSGIDPRFVASLDEHASGAADLLATLRRLNETRHLKEDEVPFELIVRPNAFPMANPHQHTYFGLQNTTYTHHGECAAARLRSTGPLILQ